MKTIQAKVNPRLLSKASRLFTGTLSGRIIEILQNSRRAGAKHVHITNHNGTVTVRDDGRDIDDFEKLLDLGGSGWEEKLEASEDPAGVGLFCLAPRELSIRSHGMKVDITAGGWTGAPVEIVRDRRGLPADKPDIAAGAGTELTFKDEPWEHSIVRPLAAFTGMQVSVDGDACPCEPFITGRSAQYRELGCRIKVVLEKELTQSHRSAPLRRDYGNNVLVNFHGQVIALSYRAVDRHDLHFLVELTGEPTGIRLMLPARTCLIENEAFKQLKAALELEAFRYILRQGRHRLPYKQYLRARELGIKLPEAEPTFHVGLLDTDESPEPISVEIPRDHPLSRCYRLAESNRGDESDEANVHLLAAVGKFERAFVPVEIHSDYEGYSWSKLSTIKTVKLKTGKVLQESWINGGKLICVESITLAVRCNDGNVFSSSVCMAIKPREAQKAWFDDDQVYVTPDSSSRLSDEQIWFHLGGYDSDGDSYDTQCASVSQQLREFWLRLLGPDQPLRERLMDCASDLKNWKSILLTPDGRVKIELDDGSEKLLLPPEAPETKEVRP